MKIKNILAGACSLALAAASQAAVNYVGNIADTDRTTVIDLASDPSGTYGGTYFPGSATSRPVWQWSAADTFVLQEIVFITGGDLFIEPGSVVRGQPRSPNVGSDAVYDPGALVIARGAKILAAGNSGAPIIFTTASTTGGATGGRASGAAPSFWDANPAGAPQAPTTAGLWGGVLICGNAPTNVDRDPATASLTQEFFDISGTKTINTDDRSTIEGIPAPSIANTGGYERFGGFAEADNSGILSYVSIRHGGANLSSNNEINGLTMGAVGRGTTINYIEIWGNTDDGVEIFGGTVNLDHIVIVAPQDDGLDLDVGYTGTVQFLAVIASDKTDKLGEWDGSYESETVNGFSASSPVTASRLPVAQFTIANATLIGNAPATPTNAFNSGLNIRDQSAPRLVNSIIVNMTSGPAQGLLEIDNRASSQFSTYNMFMKEIAYLKGVSFYSVAGLHTTAANTIANCSGTGMVEADMETKLSDAKFFNNFDNNPGFTNLPSGGTLPANLLFDPRPTSVDGPVIEDDFLGATSSYFAAAYRGAFDANEPILWTADWSAAAAYGLLVQ